MAGDKAADAQAMIKAIFEDGEAEINGRKYTYLRMTHRQRRKVFAFYSKVSHRIQAQDISFIDTPEFDAIEAVIQAAVTFDSSLLSKLGDSHWEAHPADYVTFITTSLAVISFPFFPVDLTGSAST